MGSWHHYLALLLLCLCQITGSVHPSETPGALYLPSKLPGASYLPPKLSGISYQPQTPLPLSQGTPEDLTSRQQRKMDMGEAKDTSSWKFLRVTTTPHATTHAPARHWWSTLRPSDKRAKGKSNSSPRYSVIHVGGGPTIDVTCVGDGSGGCTRDYIENQKDNTIYDGGNYNDTVSGGCVDGDNCSISAAGGYGNSTECVTGNSICGNRPVPADAAIPGDNDTSQTRPLSSLQQLWLKEGQSGNSRGQMKVKHRLQSTSNDSRLNFHIINNNLDGRLQGDARVYKEEETRDEAQLDVESVRSSINMTHHQHHQPAEHGNRNERDVDTNQDDPQVIKSAMTRNTATRITLHPSDHGTRNERDVDTNQEGDPRVKAAMKRPPLQSTKLTLLHTGPQVRQKSQAGVVASASVSSRSREGHTILSTAPSHLAILPSLPQQLYPLPSPTSSTRGPYHTPMGSVGKATNTHKSTNPHDEENDDYDYDDNERDEDGDDEDDYNVDNDDDDDDDEDRDWGSGNGGQHQRRSPESGVERNNEKKSAYHEVNTVQQQQRGGSSSSSQGSTTTTTTNRLLSSRSVGKNVVKDQRPHHLHHHQHHHHHHSRKLSRQKRKSKCSLLG